MMEGSTTWSDALRDAGPLASFSLEEAKALSELAVLVMMVDGRVSDDELEELSESLGELPFDGEEQIEEALAEHIAASLAELEESGDGEEAVDAFIEARAGRIEPGAHRRAVLGKLGELAYADGVDAGEETVIHRIGRAFGLGAQEIEEALMDGSLERVEG